MQSYSLPSDNKYAGDCINYINVFAIHFVALMLDEININDALPQAWTARATTDAIFLVAIGGTMVRVMVLLGIPLHLQQVP